MTAAKERTPSASENPSAVLSLAADARVAENSRPGFTTKKINSFQGWSEVNFKSVSGIAVSLRPEGIRSRCQSLNRYAYALNNPTTLTDPLGLDPHPLPGCGANSLPSSDDYEPCRLGGSVRGDCGIGGEVADCQTVLGLLQAGFATQCPNNVCEGFNSNGQFVQFQDFGGGASGYFRPSDLNNGINVVNGMVLTDAGYDKYIQATYAGPIEAQRQALARAIAANSNGTISYAQALADLRTQEGHLQGGNYDFATVGGLGPDSLSCGDPRCNGVHFKNGFVHLDTTNPFFGDAYSLAAHAVVDVFLGNVFFTVIPRH